MNGNILEKEGKKYYQISYLSNQTENFSVINLGNCENIIKTENGIDLEEELIILKNDYYIPDFQIPIIDYQIYDKQGNQLSLDSCSNTSIEYEIPVTINESEIYKYDPNSFYYNDFCYPAESRNGIDMTIYDRKNEYNDNNMSLCQTDCTFKGYNKETKKSICECSIMSNLPFDDIFNVDKDILLKNFINIKNIINIDVIKCYKLIFYEDGLLANYGSYIILSIILISIISSIILCIKGFNLLKNKIQNIFQDKLNKNNNEENDIKIVENSKKHIDILKNPPQKSIKKKKKKKKKYKKSNLSSTIQVKNIEVELKNETSKEIELKSEKKLINIEKYNDYEMNNLNYENALNNDKRTYIQYYFSLIKTKELLIFSFILNTDYNLRSLKISLFFLTFALNLTVNATFFNDSTMHKIYQDEGSYNFVYQLPTMIYSLLITVFIKTLLSMLSLTEKSIVKIKEQKEIDMNKITKIVKCIKIKFIIYFILVFIFLSFFWYYLSCFCALYKNTQNHLVIDTITSFIMSLFYPFLLNLIPGIFRLSALKNKNKNSQCLYKISQILQLI